jgi:hypothetical protein
MIYYEFIGDVPLNAQPGTVGTFEKINFYNSVNIINSKHLMVIPQEEEALCTQFNMMLATYLRDGVHPDETPFTKEELETGLQFRKLVKKLKLKKYYNSLIKNTFNIYDTEKETWERQKFEADKYLLDNTASTPFLDILSTNRGITKEELVTKIISKADAYATYVGTQLGLQHKAEDEIDACTTLAELDSLNLPEFCDFELDTIQEG